MKKIGREPRVRKNSGKENGKSGCIIKDMPEDNFKLLASELHGITSMSVDNIAIKIINCKRRSNPFKATRSVGSNRIELSFFGDKKIYSKENLLDLVDQRNIRNERESPTPAIYATATV